MRRTHHANFNRSGRRSHCGVNRRGRGVRSDLHASYVGGPSEDGERRSDHPLCEDVLWYPSTYLWEDETGTTRDIPQGEGGEQGDPHATLVRTWLAQGTHRGPRKVVAEREGVRFP